MSDDGLASGRHCARAVGVARAELPPARRGMTTTEPPPLPPSGGAGACGPSEGREPRAAAGRRKRKRAAGAGAPPRPARGNAIAGQASTAGVAAGAASGEAQAIAKRRQMRGGAAPVSLLSLLATGACGAATAPCASNPASRAHSVRFWAYGCANAANTRAHARWSRQRGRAPRPVQGITRSRAAARPAASHGAPPRDFPPSGCTYDPLKRTCAAVPRVVPRGGRGAPEGNEGLAAAAQSAENPQLRSGRFGAGAAAAGGPGAPYEHFRKTTSHDRPDYLIRSGLGGPWRCWRRQEGRRGGGGRGAQRARRP